MRRVAFAVLALLAGCQLHPDEPTANLVVAGEYRAVAECFYLKIRGEGFWDMKHLETIAATEVTMSTSQYRMGAITFREGGAGQTSVTFQIPHPGKFSPLVEACAGAVTPASGVN
jgi:hypothetical protein